MTEISFEEHKGLIERILRWYVNNGTWPNYVGYPEPTSETRFDKLSWEKALKEVQDSITKDGKNPTKVNYDPMSSNNQNITPSPSPAVTDLYELCKNTNLIVGSKGQCVTYAQQKLQEWGFYTRQVDGDFGEYTKQAVILFQKATGHTADGWLGPKTWSSFPTYIVAKPGVLQGDEWVLSTLMSKGDVSTEQGLCTLLNKDGTYIFYYDQGQNQQTTVTGLKGNCADLVNDLGLPYYRARGIDCRGVHCQVLCSNGVWYGHYFIEIGVQGSKVYRDPASWCKGGNLNSVICGSAIEGVNFKFLKYVGNYIP